MLKTSCMAMQQQDVSLPLEKESLEMPSTNVEENVGGNSIPEEDPSTMKDESTIENDIPSLEVPVIEEPDVIDVERNIPEDELPINGDSSEEVQKVNDSLYCEFQSEVENDKELNDVRNSGDNYKTVTENEEFDEENIDISVDDNSTNQYETNGSVEEEDKDDPVPCNSESHLDDVEQNCFQEANIAEEAAAQVLISNGETTNSHTIPSFSVNSNEVQEFCEEKNYESEVELGNSSVLSPGNGSWGGKIRAISARRPVRKSSVPPEGLSFRASRSVTPGKAAFSVGDNIRNDSSGSLSESLFTSLKRKAFDVDSKISTKKSKVDSSNSTFLSMVSSPLRLLKNKISDRIIESPKVPHKDEPFNGNSEDKTEAIEAEKSYAMKDKNILFEENSSQGSKSYKSWCSVM